MTLMADRVTGYFSDEPRCVHTDFGTPGGCRSEAAVELIGVDGDGNELTLGRYCTYHAWITRTGQWTYVRWARVDERPVQNRKPAA